MPREQLLSFSILSIIASILKNTFNLHSKTQTINFKTSTLMEFQLLVLESQKYKSKAESSPINKSGKAVTSKNLSTIN